MVLPQKQKLLTARRPAAARLPPARQRHRRAMTGSGQQQDTHCSCACRVCAAVIAPDSASRCQVGDAAMPMLTLIYECMLSNECPADGGLSPALPAHFSMNKLTPGGTGPRPTIWTPQRTAVELGHVRWSACVGRWTLCAEESAALARVRPRTTSGWLLPAAC